MNFLKLFLGKGYNNKTKKAINKTIKNRFTISVILIYTKHK